MMSDWGVTTMPVHDWSQVRAGMFHHFHNAWIYQLAGDLNAGLLPEGFYAAGEQIVADVELDVVTLAAAELSAPPWPDSRAVAVAEQAPQAQFTFTLEDPDYTSKQDRIAVRWAGDDRLVAIIEIVSRGNRSSRWRLSQFVQKVAVAIEQGCHVVVVDVQGPGALDPQGLHPLIWDELGAPAEEYVAAQPLAVVSYRAGNQPQALLQHFGCGEEIPTMPLFVHEDWYVPLPLEMSYLATWARYPVPWQKRVTGR
jgi:hypothetical protein